MNRDSAESFAAPFKLEGGLVFVIALAAMLTGCVINLGLYDEGLILVGTDLVARGAVPHRDFHANYGPAQYYVLAWLFELFGKSFWVARSYDWVIRAGIVACSYALIRRDLPRRLAAAGAAVCLVLLILVKSYLYPVYPILLLSLIGTGLLSQIQRPAESRLKVLAVGATTGAIALFRYDVGFLVLVAQCAAYTFRPRAPLRDHAKEVLEFLIIYALGTAMVFLPAAVLMAAAGAGPAFVTDFFGESAIYAATRKLPFPGLAQMGTSHFEAATYLPFLVLAVFCGQLFLGTRSARPETAPGQRDALTWDLAWLAAVLIARGIVRPSVIQMITAIVPAVILFVLIAPRLWRQSVIGKGAVSLVSIFVIETLTSGLIDRAVDVMIDPKSVLAGTLALADAGPVIRANSGLPTTSGARMRTQDLCAAELIHDNSRPDEFILSGTGRHDKIVNNNISIYFAADRRPSTHWFEYDPGWQSRADIQKAMIDELKRKKVRWIVTDRSADDADEPNDSAKSSGVTLLDRYIADRYRPVATFQYVTVRLLAGEPVPSILDQRCRDLPSIDDAQRPASSNEMKVQ